MNRFVVLDAAVEDERQRWLQLWKEWNEREVFAHPAYVALFSKSGERSLCAVLGNERGARVLFPFILRPLETEPWTRAEARGACDLTTPYGYGGAYNILDGDPPTDMFWDAFDGWCGTQRVVTSFARLPVFENQVIPFRGEVIEKGPNVVRYLDLNEEDLWRDYAHKVRKNVNRAREGGLKVEIDPEGRRLEEFLGIYTETMDRRQAGHGYYFPRSFFESIVGELAGSFAFFHVLSGGLLVSTELVLVSANHLYSFLGGTRAAAFEQRPNDLLKHEIIRWGMEVGKATFVLGGGYQAGDGIFRYKLSFAPSGEVPFRVGNRIIDPTALESLVSARRTWEATQNRDWVPSPGFFPPYRA